MRGEGRKVAQVQQWKEKMRKNLCAPLTPLSFLRCVIPMAGDRVLDVPEPISALSLQQPVLLLLPEDIHPLGIKCPGTEWFENNSALSLIHPLASNIHVKNS